MDLGSALNPMTVVFLRAKKGDGDTDTPRDTDGHVKMEAEIGVTCP